MSWERFIAAYDVHGDKQDKPTVAKFLEFCSTWKPKHRILGGDVYDFRPLRGRATDDERRESMVPDYHAGNRFIDAFSPTVFLRGNHDERLWKLREEDHGASSDFAITVCGEIKEKLDGMGCRMLPYHIRKGVYRLGELNFIHGFYAGVSAAKQTALVYGPCLFGHIHAIDEASVPGLKSRWARAVGALCRLDMDYNVTQPGTLRWEHGFPYGVVNTKTGKTHTWQARRVGGKWMLPSDFVEL